MKREILSEMDKSTNDDEETCNCLPVCNSIEYEADVSHVVLDWKEFLKASRMPEMNE